MDKELIRILRVIGTGFPADYREEAVVTHLQWPLFNTVDLEALCSIVGARVELHVRLPDEPDRRLAARDLLGLRDDLLHATVRKLLMPLQELGMPQALYNHFAEVFRRRVGKHQPSPPRAMHLVVNNKQELMGFEFSYTDAEVEEIVAWLLSHGLYLRDDPTETPTFDRAFNIVHNRR
jgi:hypothetical protein